MTSVRRLFVKAAIGVCALAGLASSGAYAASPDGMKLYQFSSYWLDIGKSALSSATSGDEKIMVPVGFYLIRHPKGDILFDTGNNDRLIQDKTYWGPLGALLDKGIDPALAIETQLGKVGVKASDIKYVILGHMHLDHAGNVSRFPNATIVVQRDEITNAFWPPKDFAGRTSPVTSKSCVLTRGQRLPAGSRRSSSTAISTCSAMGASSSIVPPGIRPEVRWRWSGCRSPAPSC